MQKNHIIMLLNAFRRMVREKHKSNNFLFIIFHSVINELKTEEIKQKKFDGILTKVLILSYHESEVLKDY